MYTAGEAACSLWAQPCLSPVWREGEKKERFGGIELAKQAESYHYGVFHQDFNIIRMKSSYKEKFASEVELRIWSEKTVQEKKMDSFMAS